MRKIRKSEKILEKYLQKFKKKNFSPLSLSLYETITKKPHPFLFVIFLGKAIGMGQLLNNYTHLTFFIMLETSFSIYIISFFFSFFLSCLLFIVTLFSYALVYIVYISLSLFQCSYYCCQFILLCLFPQMGIGPSPRICMGNTLSGRNLIPPRLLGILLLLLFNLYHPIYFQAIPISFYFMSSL